MFAYTCTSSRRLRVKASLEEVWKSWSAYILTHRYIWLGFHEGIYPKDLLRIGHEEGSWTVRADAQNRRQAPSNSLCTSWSSPRHWRAHLHCWSERVGRVRNYGKKACQLGHGFETALTAVNTKTRTGKKEMSSVTEANASESDLAIQSRGYFIWRKYSLD